MPQIEDEQVARRLSEDLKAQAVGVAALRGHGYGQVKLTPEDELLLWNREADGWTPERGLQLLAEGKSREAVGLLQFPHRQQLMESGERALDKTAQYTYARDMAKKSDPTWAPPVPSAAGPPPAALPDAQPPTETEVP
jgi:hypothetical protein